MAGNQLGKTISGGNEVAMHLTGLYPDWWTGRRYDRPVKFWAAGVTSLSTRENPQRILYGDIGQEGQGTIPQKLIVKATNSRGVANALDNIIVRHVSGGDSYCGFKSYDQGREKWQGPTLDGIWFDEEPPQDIYTEGLTRTNVGMGMTMITFTPLKGMSDVVKRFLIDKPNGTTVIQMTIDDVEHYSQEERDAIIASYPEFEREARSKGIPTMGSGRVFPLPEDFIKVEPFPIPEHWVQICGIDFGWDHPSAATRLAWDKDNDVIYVVSGYRARNQTPAMFATAVKPWGPWLKWAWPHDGLQHDKGSGQQLMAQYANAGMSMLTGKAEFEDGSNGVEAGIMDMYDRMQTGRWKVFSTIPEWFEEYRLYHRKDGLIVKLNDDLISSSRYANMMKRFAITKPKPKPNRMIGAPSQSWMG